MIETTSFTVPKTPTTNIIITTIKSTTNHKIISQTAETSTSKDVSLSSTSPQNNMINFKTTLRSINRTRNNNRPGKNRNKLTTTSTQSSFISTSPSVNIESNISTSHRKEGNTSLATPSGGSLGTTRKVLPSKNNMANKPVSFNQTQNGGSLTVISIIGNTSTKNPVYHVKKNYTDQKIENEIIKREPGKKVKIT